MRWLVMKLRLRGRLGTMPLALVLLFSGVLLSSAAPLFSGDSPFEKASIAKVECRIDELVFGKLQKLDLKPATLCSDAVFVRRAYLDLIGTLPSAQEASDF